jgi:hypothetical protein
VDGALKVYTAAAAAATAIVSRALQGLAFDYLQTFATWYIGPTSRYADARTNVFIATADFSCWISGYSLR